MKSYESDDELDRALFALELEEPPAGLRASILASTVYRRPAAVQVKPWETWALGAACAVLTWLLILIARGTAGPEFFSFASYLEDAVHLFSQPQTLFWTALGGGAALWISQLNLIPAPGASRATRQ